MAYYCLDYIIIIVWFYNIKGVRHSDLVTNEFCKNKFQSCSVVDSVLKHLTETRYLSKTTNVNIRIIL